ARGVVVALDSHETDGVRERHGAVRLVDPGVRGHDIDGDGDPEVVVARRSAAGECLAVVRIASDGSARALPIEAEGVAPGSCASALEDVDGDGSLEAIVELSWPRLALGANVPAVRVALMSANGGWRAGAMPIGY